MYISFPKLISSFGLLHLFTSAAVQSRATDKTGLNCTTKCYGKSNGADRYCQLVCVPKHPISSRAIRSLRSSNVPRRFSGGTPVSSKIIPFQLQHGNKDKQVKPEVEPGICWGCIYCAALLIMGMAFLYWVLNDVEISIPSKSTDGSTQTYLSAGPWNKVKPYVI